MSAWLLNTSLRLAGHHNARPTAAAAFCACRHFSSTRALQLGVSVLFDETGDENLDQKLKTIQDTLIMPGRLSRRQKKMVFNPKHAAKLKSDPITMEVDGVDYTFESIDRSTIPIPSRAFRETVQLMAQTNNFRNLPTLLANYRKLQIKLKPFQLSRMTRMAIESGNLSTILECARLSNKTGYTLSRTEDLVRMLTVLNEDIVKSGWSLEAVTRVFNKKKRILELLQKHEDAGIKLRHKLPVVLLMLFSRASLIKAKKEAGESVESGEMVEIHDEVVKLQTLWDRGLTMEMKDVRAWHIPDYLELNPAEPAQRLHKKDCRQQLKEAKPNKKQWWKLKLPKQYQTCIRSTDYVLHLAQSAKAVEILAELFPGDAGRLGVIRRALRRAIQLHSTCFMETSGLSEEKKISPAYGCADVLGGLSRGEPVPQAEVLGTRDTYDLEKEIAAADFNEAKGRIEFEKSIRRLPELRRQQDREVEKQILQQQQAIRQEKQMLLEWKTTPPKDAETNKIYQMWLRREEKKAVN